MSNPLKDKDPYELLAEAGDVSVYRCEQGCLHLQIGGVNIRLEDEEFHDLSTVVAEAALRMVSPRLTHTKYGRVQ